MHNYLLPASVKDGIVNRMGKLPAHDPIEAGRTTLIVLDMQNYFCASGFPHELPMACTIVPKIDRLTEAVRTAGASEHWRSYTTCMLTPDRQQKRIAMPGEASEGFKLFPGLEVVAGIYE